MEPARHLHLVDEHGEATAVCADCVRLERDLRGKRRRITELEHLLEEAQGQDPGAPEVRMVLSYFSREAVRTGWWSQSPRWKVGDERWSATQARLKDGRSVADCFVAIRGALAQDRKRTKRAYVDVTSVFRNNANFERAFEHQIDPDLRRAGRHVRELPALMVDRWGEVETQFEELCGFEGCGHILFDHHKPNPLEGVLDPPCAVHGCACTGFVQQYDVVTWAQRQLERAES